MEITKDKYYVIVTKYGFLYSVEEDYYTDVDESHDFYCFYNVKFTDSIKNVERFRGIKDDVPKYAVSKLYEWREQTLENWIKEIGGELIPVEKESVKNLIPFGSDNGIVELQEEVRYKLGYSELFKGNFPKEYFDFDIMFK